MNKIVTFGIFYLLFIGGILFFSIKGISISYVDVASQSFINQSVFPSGQILFSKLPLLSAVFTAILGYLIIHFSVAHQTGENLKLLNLIIFQPVIFICFVLEPVIVIISVLLLIKFLITDSKTSQIYFYSLIFIFGIIFPAITFPSLFLFLFFVVLLQKKPSFEDFWISISIASAGALIGILISGKLSPHILFFKFSHLVFLSFFLAIPFLIYILIKSGNKLNLMLAISTFIQLIIESFLGSKYVSIPFIMMLQLLITIPLLQPGKIFKFKSVNVQVAFIALLFFSIFITFFNFKTIIDIDHISIAMFRNLEQSALLKILSFSVFYVILLSLIIFLLLKDSFRLGVQKKLFTSLVIMLILNFTWKTIFQPLVVERKNKLKKVSVQNENR